MAKINAKTTGGGGIETVGDASGVLELQSDGTTRQYIDSNGNVGIGTSSPSTLFEISGTSSVPLRITNTSSLGSSSGGFAISSVPAIPSAADQRLGGIVASAYSSGTTYSFPVAVSMWTSEAWTSTALGSYIRFETTANGQTTRTERMRIDSSGQVLVGKSTTANNVAGVQIGVENSYGRIFFSKTLSGAVNGLLNYHNGTYVGGINYDNTNTSFPTSSDVRLKKDIVEAGSASEKIDAIRIVAHGWKHDDAVVDFGIIAQELYEVMPRAVAKGDDGEEIETTWGVDYSKLVPMLIKAHQEQQAIITDLKARIEVLEGASA